MTIIYYLLVALFRWDIRWMTKFSSMWGITRLLLVILACTTLFIDGSLIHGQVIHIQRINVQLERLEPCLQIADNMSNKQLEWGVVRKLEQSEWELRQDTDRVCEIAANKKERYQEIANRGIQDKLNPERRARFDEAVRRGLITVDGGEKKPNIFDQFDKFDNVVNEPIKPSLPSQPQQEQPQRYTKEQIMTALRNADRAGDATAARRLAVMVRDYQPQQEQKPEAAKSGFDISTAKPEAVKSGFDISTAKPQTQQEQKPEQKGEFMPWEMQWSEGAVISQPTISHKKANLLKDLL